MLERSTLFRELSGLGLYRAEAEYELKVNPGDERIDVDAKFALMRLQKSGPDSRQAAEGLLGAINTGGLGGIYGDSLIASVKYARGHHTNWWSMIAKGEDGCLVLDPSNLESGVPIIIFRSDQKATPKDGIRRIPARLDAALVKAWQTYERFRNGELKSMLKSPRTPVFYKQGDSRQGDPTIFDKDIPPKNIYPCLPLPPPWFVKEEYDLTWPLGLLEWGLVDEWLTAARVDDEPLTGESDANALLMAAKLFCKRAARSSKFDFFKEDPRLCKDLTFTRQDARVKALARRVVERGPVINWVAVSRNDRYSYIMSVLVCRFNYSVPGAAGIVGNLRGESQLYPNAVETFKTSPIDMPMTACNWQDKYSNFTAYEVRHRSVKLKTGPKKAGAGLAQWSDDKRREMFFNFEFRGESSDSDDSFRGPSILFYMDAQIECLVAELNTKPFADLNVFLKSTKDSGEATKRVLLRFEHPKNENERLMERQGNAAKAIACFHDAKLRKWRGNPVSSHEHCAVPKP